jgi:hypothetical protein
MNIWQDSNNSPIKPKPVEENEGDTQGNNKPSS